MPLFLSQNTNDGNGAYKLDFNLAAANYMLTAEYLFTISDVLDILPTLLLKSNPANNTQLDLQCNFIVKDRIWLGASFRTNGSISALLQLQINSQLRLGYSYGYELSELSLYQHGSHELMIQYNFKYLLEVISPRNF